MNITRTELLKIKGFTANKEDPRIISYGLDINSYHLELNNLVTFFSDIIDGEEKVDLKDLIKQIAERSFRQGVYYKEKNFFDKSYNDN